MPLARLRSAVRVTARSLLIVFSILVLALAAACPFAGRYLIVEMPLERADALVVLAGGQTARWLEAAELYREGYGATLVLSPGYPDPEGDRLRAQGVRFPTDAEVMRDVYAQLGVPESAILIMPGGFDNTAHEAAGARRISEQRGWKRITVVTSKYHTRRALFAFRREFAGTGTEIQVRGSRFELYTPERWWRSRTDLRWVLSEMQRLIAYRLGLGQ